MLLWGGQWKAVLIMIWERADFSSPEDVSVLSTGCKYTWNKSLMVLDYSGHIVALYSVAHVFTLISRSITVNWWFQCCGGQESAWINNDCHDWQASHHTVHQSLLCMCPCSCRLVRLSHAIYLLLSGGFNIVADHCISKPGCIQSFLYPLAMCTDSFIAFFVENNCLPC